VDSFLSDRPAGSCWHPQASAFEQRIPGLLEIPTSIIVIQAAAGAFFPRRVLEDALGSDYRVFGKVRIADLIKPENGVRRQIAFNRIAGKHVDFVVCNAADLSVIGVIELDDNSLNQDCRRKRDAFVDKAFASAGIPITRFPARAAYSLPVSKESIEHSFKLIVNKKVKPPPPLKLVVPARSDSSL
jgi:hypothetical protein